LETKISTAVFPIVAMSVLAACGTPDFGEKLKTEGAEISSLGEQWKKGETMISRGKALITKGRKRVTEGHKMIEEGEDLLESGRALQRDAENTYVQQD
jgi:hypothetical protein